MSRCRRISQIGSLAALVLALAACTSPPVPQMSRQNGSLIAIEVTLKPVLGDTRGKPAMVYLAKIDGYGNLAQPHYVATNFAKDGRTYLLDAEPGTYVAFAAYLNPPMLVTTADSVTYFSRDLVERIRVTVAEGQFAFMGSLEVAQQPWSAAADDLQVHYRELLAPKEPKTFAAQILNKLNRLSGDRCALPRHARRSCTLC